MLLIHSAVSKCFRPNLCVIHIRDLNFVLHLEIFVHYNGQLKASHLILGCIPSYTNYQDPGLALTVGSPLLSYIDIHLPGFLPRGLTVGETWERDPHLRREDSLSLIRDGSADTVFQGRAEHLPVENLTTADPDNIMVEQRNMNDGRFFLGD